MENLIYDRTQLDVINLTSKGHYNYTDLNRVESWCNYLAEKLNSYSYPVNIITKIDWTMLDFPIQSEMERIRTNLEVLKDAYYSFANLPSTAENMDYKKANEFEKNLRDINYILYHMENNFIYSGIASCGQKRIWQQRFRRKYSYFRSKTWEELTQIYWNAFTETDTWEGVSLIENNTEL